MSGTVALVLVWLNDEFKSKMAKHFLIIRRNSIQEDFAERMRILDGLSNDELISSYNREYSMGSVGVYMQAVYVLAIHHQLKLRFGTTPTSIKGNTVVMLPGLLELIDDRPQVLNT